MVDEYIYAGDEAFTPDEWSRRIVRLERQRQRAAEYRRRPGNRERSMQASREWRARQLAQDPTFLERERERKRLSDQKRRGRSHDPGS